MRIQPSRRWDKKLDAALVRIVVAVAMLVLAAQLFMAGDPYDQGTEAVNPREFMAHRYAAAGGDLNKPVVTFKLEGYSSLPLARLLVNGESAGVFSDRYVTVFADEGDTLEIDGTHYGRSFEIEVLDVSRGVAEPQPGLKIKVNGGVESISTVRVSR